MLGASLGDTNVFGTPFQVPAGKQLRLIGVRIGTNARFNGIFTSTLPLPADGTVAAISGAGTVNYLGAIITPNGEPEPTPAANAGVGEMFLNDAIVSAGLYINYVDSGANGNLELFAYLESA